MLIGYKMENKELTAFREKWMREIAERKSRSPIEKLKSAAKSAHAAWIESGTKTPSPERDAYLAAAAALAAAL